jgi:hypothetical protein
MTLHLLGTSSEADGGITAGENTPPSAELGFNTTSGGSHFLRIVPIFDIGTAGLRIVFDRPVEFFGAYFTGLGTATGDLTIELTNGTPQLFSVPGDPAGGAHFFGFTSFGDPISEISMLHNVPGLTRDIYGIDDITTPVFVIPEPGACLLMASGLMVIAVRRRLS